LGRIGFPRRRFIAKLCSDDLFAVPAVHPLAPSSAMLQPRRFDLFCSLLDRLGRGRNGFGAFLAIAVIPCLACAAPLSLIASLDGRQFDHFVPTKKGWSGKDPAGDVVLPNWTEWHIRGDLAANARFFRLSPEFTLERTSPRRSPMAASTPYTHTTKIRFTYTPNAEPPWGSRALNKALIVFAWIHGGKAIRAAAVPVTNSLDPWDAEARITFFLDEQEARGFPAVLLWKDGAFLAPAPMIKDAAAEAWLQAVYFPTEGVDLIPPPAIPPRNRTSWRVGLLPLVAEGDFLAAVEALLRVTPASEIGSSANIIALNWAASKGRTATVRRLVAAGVKLNEPGWRSVALRYAILNRHDLTAAELVAAGAPFEVKTNGFSEADHAFDLGLPRTLTAIAAKGGLAPFQGRLNARLAEAVGRESAELVEALIALGASPGPTVERVPLLALAASRPHAADVIRALVAAGADPQQADPSGLTPVAIAVRAGETENVRTLLSLGASVRQADSKGRTALHYAAAAADTMVLPLLVAAGANVLQTDHEGLSPLSISLARQSLPMLKALVAQGAAIDLRSAGAAGLLAEAVLLDQLELLQRAAADGWNPASIPGNPRAPLTLARYARAHRVATWLEQRGLNADTIPRLGPSDQGPLPSRTPIPADPRVEDFQFPEQTVLVSALVETDGSLTQVVAASPHERLRVAALAAVRTWHFKPAVVDGTVAPLAVTIPIQFPARDNRLFTPTDVDSEPVLSRSGSLMEELAHRLEGAGVRWSGSTEVGFVVERDGSTSRITLKDGLPADFVEIIRKTVATAEFQPAKRQGKPVHCWI